MEKRNKLFLQFRLHINQQVPANQYVKLGKGRIHDHILGRKDYHFTDLPRYPVAIIVTLKEPPQPFRETSVAILKGKHPARALSMASLSRSVANICNLKFPVGLTDSIVSLNMIASE